MNPRAVLMVEADPVLQAEREAIWKTLDQTHWNRAKTARLLRVSYRALPYKIQHLGLDAQRPSARSEI